MLLRTPGFDPIFQNKRGTGFRTSPERGSNLPVLPGMEKVRGIRKLKPKADRPKSFGVEWRVAGKPTTEWYEKAVDRDKRYDALVKEHRKGVLGQAADRREMAEWLAFKTAIGEGTDWRDVVAGWRSHLQMSGRSTCAKTVAEACAEYMEHQEKLFKEGRLSADTMRHKRQKIGELFSASFGSNKLDQVSGDDIETWIVDDLGFENADTINTYRKHIRALYSYFSKDVPRNPADDIEVRDASIEYVNILTVRDTARLFEYALKNARVALGRLAIEAFVGLRFGSGQRLEKTDVNFEDKGILLPAKKIKTGRRHYIDGLPENLWSWLDATTADCWTLTPSEWMHLKSDLFRDAKVPHPRNCLRHSFATYHVWARLRRKEADLLAWEQIDFENGQIHVRRTAYFEPKTEESRRSVDLPPEAVDLLRSFKQDSESDFVLIGALPNPAATYDYYRCDCRWRNLHEWLRGKGVRQTKVIHALRKESGAFIAYHFGIEVARQHLGHRDIRTTSSH